MVTLTAGWALLDSARAAAADVPGAGIVRDTLGGAGGWAFDSIAAGVAGSVLGAVGDIVGGVVGFLGAAPRPSLDAVWFSGPGSPFALVRGIALSLLLGFVFLAVIQGLVTGEPGAGAGRVARDLFLAVVGMAATVTVTVKLLDLTDALSRAVLGGVDNQALQFLSGFGSRVTSMTGGFGLVLVGLVVAVAALLVWIELMVRAALVYLLVALTPLAFAAMTWPAARGVLRRTVELLLAVIVSKFVICVAIAVGTAALGQTGTPPTLGAGEAIGGAMTAAASLGALISGGAILALAAFSPFVVLKLMPFAEAAVMAQGISRSPVRGAQAGMSTYYYANSIGRLAGSSAGGRTGPVTVPRHRFTADSGTHGNGTAPASATDHPRTVSETNAASGSGTATTARAGATQAARAAQPTQTEASTERGSADPAVSPPPGRQRREPPGHNGSANNDNGRKP
jgi:hypothetical protein